MCQQIRLEISNYPPKQLAAVGTDRPLGLLEEMLFLIIFCGVGGIWRGAYLPLPRFQLPTLWMR